MKRVRRNTQSQAAPTASSSRSQRTVRTRADPAPHQKSNRIGKGKGKRRRKDYSSSESDFQPEDDVQDTTFLPPNPTSEDDGNDSHEPSEADSNAKVDRQDQHNQSTTLSIPKKDIPTIKTYAEAGRKLGQPILEKLLADPRRPHQNRPSRAVIDEARALQGFYTTDKMSLSVVAGTSLRTLESYM